MEGGWLTAAYSMTSVCMSLLLIKFRQQFGLQRFTRIFLLCFLALTVLQVFSHTFWAELLLRGGAGVVGSALTSLCFYYLMQAMPAAKRLSGMIIGFGSSQIALPLARIISPLLLNHGDIQNLFLFELGLTLAALASVALLRLPPSKTIDAFEPLDFLTFALMAPGVGLLCLVLALGRIVWWTTPWLGICLAVAIPLIAAGLWIEHNRANPLLNTRWMSSRNIIRFAVVAIALRILLSEQNYGSIGLMTVLGMGADQLVSLNIVVMLASIAGLVASLVTMNPNDLSLPIVIAVALVGIGAFLDSGSTNLTRPTNLYLSQSLIAFAALFFLGPMVMIGLVRALARGLNHIISFSALFSITQNLGGLAGGAMLGTFQIVREKYHSYELVQSLTLIDPQVAARVQALGGVYIHVINDPVLRQAQGAALLAQQVAREANVLAYNDVFLVIAVLSLLVFLWLGARWIRMRIQGIDPLAEDRIAFSRLRETQ